MVLLLYSALYNRWTEFRKGLCLFREGNGLKTDDKVNKNYGGGEILYMD